MGHGYQAFRYVKCVSTLQRSCVKKFATEPSLQVQPGSKVVINDVGIHYEKVGSGNHALLLLPGGHGSSRTDFKPQLEQLDRNKFTLVAWDAPGFGFSRPPNRCFSVDMFHKDADFAASLMQRLNFTSYSVAGWSDGGITALILAGRHADKVRKLVVWGTSAYLGEKDIRIFRGLRNVDTWSQRLRETMFAMYGEACFRQAQAQRVDIAEKIYDSGGDICKDFLSKIVCPSLIIHGMKDPILPEEHATYLQKAIEHSRLEKFTEGKHNVHLRFSKEFNIILERFLQE